MPHSLFSQDACKVVFWLQKEAHLCICKLQASTQYANISRTNPRSHAHSTTHNTANLQGDTKTPNIAWGPARPLPKRLS